MLGFYGAETIKERIAKAPPPLNFGRKKEGKTDGERLMERDIREVERAIEVPTAKTVQGEGLERITTSSIGNWLTRERMD